MPNLDDFHAFQSTSGGSGGSGGGCFTPIVVIGIIIFVLYLIGELFA